MTPTFTRECPTGSQTSVRLALRCCLIQVSLLGSHGKPPKICWGKHGNLLVTMGYSQLQAQLYPGDQMVVNLSVCLSFSHTHAHTRFFAPLESAYLSADKVKMSSIKPTSKSLNSGRKTELFPTLVVPAWILNFAIVSHKPILSHPIYLNQSLWSSGRKPCIVLSRANCSSSCLGVSEGLGSTVWTQGGKKCQLRCYYPKKEGVPACRADRCNIRYWGQ